MNIVLYGLIILGIAGFARFGFLAYRWLWPDGVFGDWWREH